MNYTQDKHNQAKSDMLGEFNKAILDAEDLRKAETEVSDARSAAAQKILEQKSEGAGADAAGISGTAVETEKKSGEDSRNSRVCSPAHGAVLRRGGQ